MKSEDNLLQHCVMAGYLFNSKRSFFVTLCALPISSFYCATSFGLNTSRLQRFQRKLRQSCELRQACPEAYLASGRGHIFQSLTSGLLWQLCWPKAWESSLAAKLALLLLAMLWQERETLTSSRIRTDTSPPSFDNVKQ